MLRTIRSYTTTFMVFAVVVCVFIGLTSCIEPIRPVAVPSTSDAQTETVSAPLIVPTLTILTEADTLSLVPKSKVTDLLKNGLLADTTDLLTDTFVLLPGSEVPQELMNTLTLTDSISNTLVLIASGWFVEFMNIPEQALLAIPENRLKSKDLENEPVGLLEPAQPITLPQTNVLQLQLTSKKNNHEFVLDVVFSDEQVKLSFSKGAGDPPADVPVPCRCWVIFGWCPC